MSTDEELLSVVDLNDRVIGVRCRSEVHEFNLPHRAVHILVFNSKGDLFLQRRSQNKDVNAGLWDSSAAGHVDHGETYDACALRELNEELGVGLESLSESLGTLSPLVKTGMEFCRVYRVTRNGPFVLNKAEIDCGEWFSVDHINRWIKCRPDELTTTFILIWREFFQSGIQNKKRPV